MQKWVTWFFFAVLPLGLKMPPPPLAKPRGGALAPPWDKRCEIPCYWPITCSQLSPYFTCDHLPSLHSSLDWRPSTHPSPDHFPSPHSSPDPQPSPFCQSRSHNKQQNPHFIISTKFEDHTRCKKVKKLSVMLRVTDIFSKISLPFYFSLP